MNAKHGTPLLTQRSDLQLVTRSLHTKLPSNRKPSHKSTCIRARSPRSDDGARMQLHSYALQQLNVCIGPMRNIASPVLVSLDASVAS